MAGKIVKFATWPLRFMWHHKIMTLLVVGSLVGTSMWRNSASRQAAEAEKAARVARINKATYDAEDKKIKEILAADKPARQAKAEAAKPAAAPQAGGIVYRTDSNVPVDAQVKAPKPAAPAAPWMAPLTDKSPDELTGFEKVSNGVAKDQAIHPELGGVHTVLVCDENNHANYSAACFGVSVSRTTNTPKLYRFAVQGGEAPTVPHVNLAFADNPKIGFGIESEGGEIKGGQVTADDPLLYVNPRGGVTLLWVNKDGEIGQEQDPAKVKQLVEEIKLFEQGKGAKIKSQPFTIAGDKQPQQTASCDEVKTPGGAYYMPRGGYGMG